MSGFEKGLEQILSSDTLPANPDANSPDIPFLLPKESLGQIEIQRHLATGSESRLYIGHDHHDDQPVVVKHFGEGDLETRQRVKVELATHKKLENISKVIGLHGMGSYRGHRYVALELADTTLGQMPADSVLDVEAIIPVLDDTIEAVEVMHEFGLLHRDLKPPNIFVKDGEGRLGDFGIVMDCARTDPEQHKDATSQQVDKGTLTTKVFGTEGFIAPESAKDGVFSVKTDIFALGATMYKVFTGVALGQGSNSNMVEYLKTLTKGERGHISDINPVVPRRLGDLAMSLVSNNPDQRPSSASEIRNVLATI